MKKLILLLSILLGIVVLTSVFSTSHANNENNNLEEFKMSVGNQSTQKEISYWVDKETGVEYIIIEVEFLKTVSVSITPRLNSDGSIRVK